MDNIMKEWPVEFLVPINDAELSDTDIIGIPLVTWVKHTRQCSAKKKMKRRNSRI
jgi:hypothetical protein